MIQQHIQKLSPVFDRPFIFFMGPQRAGTSWIDRYLRERGDVCLPTDVKEVFFFDRDFEKGVKRYVSHFHPLSHHKIISEISTTSFDHVDAPQRVYEVFGENVQLICPLRHPVERSYSLYLHYLRYGIVSGSLQEACAQHPQIIESSYYTNNLQRWLKYYELNKIKIVYQEMLADDQDQFIHEICQSMGLPYMEPPEKIRERYNVTTYSKSGYLAGTAQKIADKLRQKQLYFIINFVKALGVKRVIFGKEKPDDFKQDISSEDLKFLNEKLKPEIEKLEHLLGSSINFWK